MVTTTTDQTGSNRNTSELKEDLKNSGEQLNRAMKDAGENLSKETKVKAEGAKDYAADEFEDLSQAAESAAQALNDNHHETLSSYVGEIAGYVEGMANNLRHKSADELMQNATQMARENPALFMAGSLAIGLGIARLAKSGMQHGTPKEKAQSPMNRSSDDSQSHGEPFGDLNKKSSAAERTRASEHSGMKADSTSSTSVDNYGSGSYSKSPNTQAPNLSRPNPNL